MGKFKLKTRNQLCRLYGGNLKKILLFFFAYRCPLFEFYTRTPTFIVVETLKDVSTYNYAVVNFGGMKQMRWK